MLYYRGCSSINPMSIWGHAMFSEDEKHLGYYGPHYFTFDSNQPGVVNINDLKDIIASAWIACQESGNFGDMCDAYYESLSPEQVFESLNPQNIVSSAEAYDCDLGIWFYQFVIYPNDIKAVTTWNGAVVWDTDLIKYIGTEESI